MSSKATLLKGMLAALAVLAGSQGFAQVLDGSGNPLFKEYTPGTGTFTLDSSSRIVLLADNPGLIETLNAEQGWLDKFRYATGLRLNVTVINSASVTSRDIVLSSVTTALFSDRVSSATLTVVNGGSNVQKAIGGNVMREGYEYSAGTGGLTVRFAEDMGAFRAVQSLVQMVIQDGQQAGAHRSLPTGTGIDYPAMEKRIFGMDVAHYFVPAEVVIGLMEKMSQHKLNALHLKIAARGQDSGGTNRNFFRLDLGDSTRQAAMNHSGGFYTQQDWEAMEEAAKRYGIDIIPEFPSPRRAVPWTSDTQSPPGSANGDIAITSGARNSQHTIHDRHHKSFQELV